MANVIRLVRALSGFSVKLHEVRSELTTFWWSCPRRDGIRPSTVLAMAVCVATSGCGGLPKRARCLARGAGTVPANRDLPALPTR